MQGFTLADPRWLALAALIVPLALLAVRFFTGMTRLRLASAIALRTALLGVIALMLAGAASVREVDRRAVVAVVDVSDSVLRYGDFGTGEDERPLDAASFVRAYVRGSIGERGRDELLGVIAFDGRPTAVALPSRGDVLGRPIEASGREGSALGAAIEQASALIPPDAAGRIVVFSDGNETGGSALEAARGTAVRRGTRVPIDVVPLPYRVGEETVVERLDAPEAAAGESTVRLRVTIRASAPASGTLRVTREGEPVDINGDAPGTGRRLDLNAGREVVLVDVPLGPERLHRFEAVFEPDRTEGGRLVGDSVTANNRAEAFTLTPGKGRVLFVDGVNGATPGSPGMTLPRTLRREGVEVEAVPPSAVPNTLLGLQSYDLVVLSNTAAYEIDERAQDQLDAYVRDLGGGLLLLGGPKAFGAGAWKGSILEPIMPVKLDLPERLVIPEAAIMFVLDNSGSMRRSVLGSSRSQQEIANEAAARAIGTLDEKDLVGVVSFNSTPSVVRDLGPNDNPDRTADLVRGIGSGGGTSIAPALRIAREQMRAVDAKIKHVIVLTDGRSEGPGALPDLAASLRDDGVRVSTIGVGDEADVETLEAMAARGDGTFYRVVNPNVLPRVLLKAVRVVRSPLVRETPFQPVLLPTGSPLIAGMSEPPRLEGLVLAQARESADVLNAMATPGGEPLLAHWRVELGQVAAFTSDAHRWAERWLDWQGYAPFWTRVVRTISRPGTESAGELRVRSEGDRLRLRYESIDDEGEPRDLLSVPVTVYGPAGASREIRLRQTAPGVYEADAPAGDSGTYIAVATPSQGGQRLAPSLAGTTNALGVEHARLEPNVELLRRIADTTGGRVLDPRGAADVSLFEFEDAKAREALTPLLPVLMVWMLILFLADVATRRIAWDRFISNEYAGGRVLESRRPRLEQSAASGLRAVRERAREHRAAGAKAMGEEDARRVEQEQFSRRMQAERDRIARLRQATRGTPAEPAPDEKQAGPEPKEREDSGLLAAKRRARQKYEDREE